MVVEKGRFDLRSGSITRMILLAVNHTMGHDIPWHNVHRHSAVSSRAEQDALPWIIEDFGPCHATLPSPLDLRCLLLTLPVATSVPHPHPISHMYPDRLRPAHTQALHRPSSSWCSNALVASSALADITLPIVRCKDQHCPTQCARGILFISVSTIPSGAAIHDQIWTIKTNF